jgi:hypothetical protein
MDKVWKSDLWIFMAEFIAGHIERGHPGESLS